MGYMPLLRGCLSCSSDIDLYLNGLLGGNGPMTGDVFQTLTTMGYVKMNVMN